MQSAAHAARALQVCILHGIELRARDVAMRWCLWSIRYAMTDRCLDSTKNSSSFSRRVPTANAEGGLARTRG